MTRRRLGFLMVLALFGLAWATLPPLTHLLPARLSGVLIDLKGAVTPDRPPPAPPRDADVVYVGDSLVARMPRLGAANLGVNGETVDDVRARIAGIVAARPRRIVLLVGANDLLRGASAAAVAADYERLLRAIPEPIAARVVSLTPMRHGVQRRIPPPERIDDVNERLRALAEDYVDVQPPLADPDGRLKAAFTEDGIHLNAAGYGAIEDLVRAP